jgi:hypothetical protein
MFFRTYYGFYCPPIFWFREILKNIFVATVFEIECCAFGDVERTYWRFIVENCIKIDSSYPKILGAELDL